LQSLFGVYSLRIENVGVRRPPSDDVKIQGVANPNAFRKVINCELYLTTLNPSFAHTYKNKNHQEEISFPCFLLPHQVDNMVFVELHFAMLPFFSGCYDASIEHEK